MLLGAISGLFAQEAAFATAPTVRMPSDTHIASPAMSDECAESMGIDAPDESAPCNGLTLDCIAKMGCAVPLAFITSTSLLTAADERTIPAAQRPVARLTGRSFGPEPEPPLLLG